MWLVVGVAAAFVLVLALSLAVLCHPPILEKLPAPLRKCFGSLAEMGRARAEARRVGGDQYNSIKSSLEGSFTAPGEDEEEAWDGDQDGKGGENGKGDEKVDQGQGKDVVALD